MNITDADREAMVETIMDRAIGCCNPSQQDAEELLYDLTPAITHIEEDARLRGYNAGLEAAAQACDAVQRRMIEDPDFGAGIAAKAIRAMIEGETDET